MGIRIGILGPLEVRDSSGQDLPVTGIRLRSLLIRLLVAAGRPVTVDALAADLWPDASGPADAPNAVQALVSRLRTAIGKDAIEYGGPAGYRLRVLPGSTDADAFERQAEQARALAAAGDNAAAAQEFRQALALWRGPALADVADAPFAGPVIARLDELRMAAIQDGIDARLALGRGAQLVPEIEQLAAEHPLSERLRAQQMRALCQAGRQADALGVFEDTRLALASELGVDPSPALSGVHLAILRGDLFIPERAASRPAVRPSPNPAGNLPAQLTSFVGRDDELDRVTSVLSESRLVTLTGPGGAGKTRLSVEVGSRIAGQAPDGVWFVPLAPVRDAIDVPQAVLTAIDGRDTSWRADPVEAARLAAMEPLDRLTEVLTARTLVLVLDNCEHVLDAVAELAGRVLAGGPGVRILATSREPLGLTGETLCPVPSLTLPPAGADLASAVRSPAVQLFADRAAAVRPGFQIDADSVDPIVRICRALDGIPLAIELAAARVRALTPGQVADRLDDRFALLSTGTRGALPRHQTLRAIVDWSWELLDDAERAVLRRLSVFSGGATPGSAEQVCAPEGDTAGVIDVIASLVDKSLVTATGAHEVRYRLLETVRAYAADRLAEAGDADRAADVHAAYFLDLAERAEPELHRHDQVTWLDRLMAEHDNFSAALRHVITSGDAALAVRFVRALLWFWLMRDYEAEAAEWAIEILQLTGDDPPDGLTDAYAICKIIGTLGMAFADSPGHPDLGQLRNGLRRLRLPALPEDPLLVLAAPILALMLGDRDSADRMMQSAADHPDPWARAARRSLLGYLEANDGHIDLAYQELTAALGMFESLGDKFGLVICLRGLAEVALGQGRAVDAVRLLEEARVHAVDGLAANMGETLRIPLARARLEAGDVAAARADVDEGIRQAEKLSQVDDAVWGHILVSEIARREGDLAAARDALEHATEIVQSKHRRPDMAGPASATYSKLGSLAEQEGDLAASGEWHQRALAELSQPEIAFLPSNPNLAVVVEGIAALTAARGDYPGAAELLGLAHRLQGFTSETSLEVRRARAAITTNLGEAEVQAAYERGRRLDRAHALALRPAG